MAKAFASDDELGEASPIELRRGTRLGRYELLLPIAKGGMARVWAARQHGQRGFTKLVAIKTILPHLAREGEFERMFLDEARIASLVHHPNVCEIYELGDDGGVLYLAMEWVSGDSLMHVLRGSGRVEAIDLRIAARIIADAAAGLHAAHELTDDDNNPMNVVHRDVSPHNILISGDGHIKVADFGVAKALGQMHSATIAGQIKGKIAYMAPEQISSTKFDRRADVFALGCILYEVTTGLQPFLGDSDPQVMHAIMKGDYVTPGKLMVGYPHHLEQIIQKALSQDPKDRFATADHMKLELEQWLSASGPFVTTTAVGALVKQRLGALLERRREKIKDASQAQTSESMNAPGGVAHATPAAGSTSGVREHRERQPSQANFGSNASGPYPNQTGSGPGISAPGTSAPGTPNPAGPPHAIPAASSSDSGAGAQRQRSYHSMPPPADAPPGVAELPQSQIATNYGQTAYNPQASRPAAQGQAGLQSFNPLQPFAGAPPGNPMRYVIAVGLGIAAAMALTLIVVVIMALTKKSSAPPPPAPASVQSVTTQAPQAPEPTQAALPQTPPQPTTSASALQNAPAQSAATAQATSHAGSTAETKPTSAPVQHHEAPPPTQHRPTPLPLNPPAEDPNSN